MTASALSFEEKESPSYWHKEIKEIAKLRLENPTFLVNKQTQKTYTFIQIIKEIEEKLSTEEILLIKNNITHMINMKGDIRSYFLSIARQLNKL